MIIMMEDASRHYEQWNIAGLFTNDNVEFIA